ncbi:MAG: hypothetical protein GY854_11925 [Deltaproteobacteria bacterium]|nr:hypothetical protein [Deltaproteobacteria bacterium]
MTETKIDDKTPSEHDRELGAAALGVLVNQFGNAFDFVRELVQNSLDSGTAMVEVWTDFHVEDEHGGMCEIHVEDSGMGMDEDIIDNRLTRLFSSTKEDDLTHIGKFGIGFVSVFAIKPQGVLVKTARGGERWEVFFDEERNIEKSLIEEPFEGTHVTVFKTMSPADYQDAVKSIISMLRYWCKHAEKRIVFFDNVDTKKGNRKVLGKSRRRRQKKVLEINEPMRVPGFAPITARRGETEIAMAFSRDNFYGFYNKGLTLKETKGLDIPNRYRVFFDLVSFKIKSPYLEHTLTRDTILRDANFEKALDLLMETARTDLVENLLALLEKKAGLSQLVGDDLAFYLDALDWLYCLPRELDPTFGMSGQIQDVAANVSRAVRFKQEEEPSQMSVDASKRQIFRKCHGDACTLKEVVRSIRATDRRLLLSTEENEMTSELFEEGKAVFFSRFNDEFFVHHVTGETEDIHGLPRISELDSTFWLVANVDTKTLSSAERQLLEKIEQVVELAGFQVQPVNFLGDNPEANILSAILVKKNIALADKGGEGDIALDVKGRVFVRLAMLYSRAPDLAVLLTVRRLVLESVGNEERIQKVASAMEEVLS